MTTAPCLSFPVLFPLGCSSREFADGAARPHPNQGLTQGWHEHPKNSLICCLWEPVTPFPGAGMAILVLHLVTLPFMCQVWMSPVLGAMPPSEPEAALEYRGARGCSLTTKSLWKIPKNPQNYVYLTFCKDGNAPGRILGCS